MIYAFLTILTSVLAVLTAVIWFREKHILESVVLGVCWFFCSHVLCSMGLFVLDVYTVLGTMCLTAVFDAAVLAAAVRMRRSKPFSVRKLFCCDMSLKPVLIPVLVCLMALPLVSVKNEYFGMGQDEGVYQTQVLYFLNGDTKRQKDFPEFALLESEEERESFRHLTFHAIGGYDIPSANYPETSYDRSVSPVSGIIHGIPTYSALLAMWSTLFGVENMLGIETVFYVCLIFLVWCCCRNLGLKTPACLTASVSAALAPIVLWVAKSALTECFLAVIMTLFLYFLSDDVRKELHWLSIIPVAVFGCYHVSLYTVMPLFLMVYGGLYVFTRRRVFAILLPGTVLLYLVSFFAMRQVQPVYTMNNYLPALVGGLSVGNLTTLVPLVCGVLLAVCGGFLFFVGKTKKLTNRRASKSKLFCVFILLLLVMPVLFIAVRGILTYERIGQFRYLTLWGYACNCGVLLVPAAMLAGVLKPKFYILRNSRLVVLLTFFYCILVYAAVLRFDIQYYYYYGRYLAPFVPVGCVFAAMTLDRLGKRVLYPALAGSMALSLRFDYFLMQTKDDTRMEWRVLDDLASLGSAEDCCVIDRELLATCWLSLRQTAQADVFPELNDREAQLRCLNERYAHVIFITGTDPGEKDFDLLYRNTYLHSEDDNHYPFFLVPMTLNYYIVEEPVFAAVYEKYQNGYDYRMDYDRLRGFSGVEDGWCWSCEENAEIACRLKSGAYTLELRFGAEIPLHLFEDGVYPLTISVNGKKLRTVNITAENNGAPVTLQVREEWLQDGNNTITLSGALWDASAINPAETRRLGFPFASLRMLPA